MADRTNDEPDKVMAWAYVITQAVILSLLIFLNRTFGFDVKTFKIAGDLIEWLGVIGIILSAITIRSSLTAVPLPKKHGRLGTTGLYKYVRHPMYTSVLLLSLGIALLSGSIIKYLLVFGLFVLFSYKARYEERYLSLKYPNYAKYAEQTPRFIPFIK